MLGSGFVQAAGFTKKRIDFPKPLALCTTPIILGGSFVLRNTNFEDFLMAHVHAFKALMPTPEAVTDVSAVPYDVVDRGEAAALAAEKPLSFLHVSRSEIDLPADTNPYSDAVYAKAVENFANLRETAPLSFDDEECLYIYSQTMGEHTQTGIVGAVAVDDYDSNLIKKHEKTRKAKEDDRTRHTCEIRCHSGPVFLLYDAREDIDAMVADVRTSAPHFDVRAEDGTRHQVWRCPADLLEKMLAAFAQVPDLYVADGHHRAKSASRTRETMRANNPNHTGDEAYNRFLTVMFPGNQLQILPYNRVVEDLNGLDADAFMARVNDVFDVTPDVVPKTEYVGDIRMYLDGKWYGLKIRNVEDTGKVADTLDVAILQDQCLNPVLGIEDPRTSNRINFIGGIRGTGELEKLVDSGTYAVAFSMYPVTVEQLIAISDASEIMPPKSTWFEPKLRDGLLVHCF